MENDIFSENQILEKVTFVRVSLRLGIVWIRPGVQSYKLKKLTVRLINLAKRDALETYTDFGNFGNFCGPHRYLFILSSFAHNL